MTPPAEPDPAPRAPNAGSVRVQRIVSGPIGPMLVRLSAPNIAALAGVLTLGLGPIPALGIRGPAIALLWLDLGPGALFACVAAGLCSFGAVIGASLFSRVWRPS